MLRLPDDLRGALKEPLGPIFTDPERLLSEVDADAPLVAVGDVVTYHLRRVGREPDVAVIDGKTKRDEVDDEIREALAGGGRRVSVENEPATISEQLLRSLRDALDADEPTVIVVDGEEDLAALPAILAAPEGSSVVYGQPNEGMVLVRVAPETRAEVRSLLERFAGSHERAFETLGV
jgi:uncharacterized protein (UPF0218 family)